MKRHMYKPKLEPTLTRKEKIVFVVIVLYMFIGTLVYIAELQAGL